MRHRKASNVRDRSARYDYAARGVAPGQVWKSRRSDRVVTVVLTRNRQVWYEEETAAGLVRREVTAWHLVQRYRMTGVRSLWQVAVTAGELGQPLDYGEGLAVGFLRAAERRWPQGLAVTAGDGVLRLVREGDEKDVIATFSGIWFRP